MTTWWGLEPTTWAELVVAACTLALAIATVVLAIFTRNMAKETRHEAAAVRQEVTVATKQVDVSEAAYRAAIMPWLTVAPYGSPGMHLLRREVEIIPRTQGVGGTIQVINIGNGLAVIPEQGVTVIQQRRAELGEALVFPGAANPPAIGLRDSSVVSFRIPRSSAAAASMTLDQFAGRTNNCYGGFDIDVRFTDATGEQSIHARFHAYGNSEGRFHVHSVSYLHPHDEKPFLTTDFGWPSVQGGQEAGDDAKGFIPRSD